MKIIAHTDKFIKNIKPYQIRKALGSLVNKKYLKKILWHEKHPSPLFYAPTFKNSFVFYNYTNDFELVSHIQSKLLGANIYGYKIKSVEVVNEDYSIPSPNRLFLYKTVSPIILSTNNTEFKLVYAINKNVNENDLNDYLKNLIERTVKYKLKYFYGLENFNFSGFNVMLKDYQLRLINIKAPGEEKKRQALFCQFVSNYELPKFVGYVNGLGFGMLSKFPIYT